MSEFVITSLVGKKVRERRAGAFGHYGTEELKTGLVLALKWEQGWMYPLLLVEIEGGDFRMASCGANQVVVVRCESADAQLDIKPISSAQGEKK